MIEKINKTEDSGVKKEENIKVVLAKNINTGKIIGYCYGKIYNNKAGELISIYNIKSIRSVTS